MNDKTLCFLASIVAVIRVAAIGNCIAADQLPKWGIS